MAPAILSTHCFVVMEPREEPGWKLYRLRPKRLQRLSSSTSRAWLFSNTSGCNMTRKPKRGDSWEDDITTARKWKWAEWETERERSQHTLFRRSTVHEVGPMRQDVSWDKPLQCTLLPKLVCSCVVQDRPLPWPLRAQKQGKTAASHLYAGAHCFPNPTWGQIKEATKLMCVTACLNYFR